MPPYIPKDAVALLARIPSARQANFQELYRRLKTLLDRSPHARSLSILKYAAYIVLLINFGSLPFIWHIRVFWPILALRLEHLALRIKLVFASKKARTNALLAWGESLSPVGADPFEVTVVYKRWASIDDIDVFGMHLSNSSYAKAFDSVRVRALVKWFPAWGRSGGQMALGATHYHFLREIPPLVRYEVRLTIGAWDHKWMYIVARFVTRPRSRHGATYPPSQSDTPNGAPVPNGSADVESAVAAIVQDNNGSGSTPRAPIFESDGAILHCVAVSQICFKLGRITIPPAIVLASEGFTKSYGDGENFDSATVGAADDMRSYSRVNPPPNWIKSQLLRMPPHGSMNNFRAFIRGRWRDAPEAERWWEDALGGSIERKRQANLEILDSLKLGLERTRTLR